ncbi:MAG: SpoIID/LytB domain-containing protein, partial [Clostridiales bacterium]|nr:SpoIID/LytB domain-containing protein [Clostridiales bacterium]
MIIEKDKNSKTISRLAVVSAIVLAAALALPFLPAAPAAYAASALSDTVVRVQLSSYGQPASFSMKATGAHTITANGKSLSGAFTAQTNSKGILITAGSNSWQLGGDVTIAAGSTSTDNLIQISGGYQYAGDLRILQSGGGLKLVNQLPIDTYVAGVLPYEMSNAWPAEALKAQAVATRSYAYYKMCSINRAGTDQDIANSDQSYYGYNASYSNCMAAAKATAGQVLETPSGGAVYACYGASNGGNTEYPKSSGAAGTNFDYLPYKADSYDLSVSLSSAAYGAKVTVPKTIKAADLKTSDAQPYKFLREKLSGTGVDVSSIPSDVSVKSIALTNPNYSSPDRAWLGATITLGLPKTAAAAARDIALAFGPYTPSGSTSKYPFLNQALGVGTRYGMLYLRDDGTSWLLAAVRCGHASGLSQIGAYQMANSGKTYKDILAFYYNLGSSTKLVTLTGNSTAATATPPAATATTPPAATATQTG